MLKHATLITVIGFFLLILGMLTLFLNIVGVDLFFLAWLYKMNPSVSFLIRILAVVFGVILIYVGQTDWDREEI